MLIAEELLLVGTDPQGRNLLGSSRNLAVAGAFLTELALLERLRVDDRRGLRVVDRASTGDVLLDDALVRFAEREGKKPKDVLERVGKHLVGPVLDGLSRRELVRPEPVKLLGLTLATRWPLVTSRAREEVRADLARVVTGAQDADSHTGALISLLHAVDALPKVVTKDQRPGLTNREVRRRAKEISAGRWAPEAVAKAVQEAAAAATAAIAAAGAAGAAGGGSS